MTYTFDSHAVAQYLADNPHFFEENAELLSQVKLASALSGRAVSLHERQMEVLRQKIKGLELRIAEMIRLAQENDAIAQKFQSWTRSLLLARNDVDLPHTLIEGLQTTFTVPHATLRLWHVAEKFSGRWFTDAVSEEAKKFANSLSSPFCGKNTGFEPASWIDTAAVQSIAMLPLHASSTNEVFGLLVLGSADPDRFTSDMATDFLVKIAQTASAALACLRG